MSLIEKIQNVFPRPTDIPKTLLNGIPCIQTGYLINGEIGSGTVRARRCSRPFGWRETRIRSLFSLVNIRLFREAEAFQALDAAVAAKQTNLNKQIITCMVRDHKSKFLATDFIF